MTHCTAQYYRFKACHVDRPSRALTFYCAHSTNGYVTIALACAPVQCDTHCNSAHNLKEIPAVTNPILKGMLYISNRAHAAAISRSFFFTGNLGSHFTIITFIGITCVCTGIHLYGMFPLYHCGN